MAFKDRKFVVFDVTELDIIDFFEVLETSANTVRRSVDGTKTFVKWDSDQVPNCVENLQTKSNYMTYEEILVLMQTLEWTTPIEVI